MKNLYLILGILFLVIGIFCFACGFISWVSSPDSEQSPPLASQKQSDEEVSTTQDPSVILTQSPTLNPVIVRFADQQEQDGVRFTIGKIWREIDTVDPINQIVFLEVEINSSEPGWTGFDVKSQELIVDFGDGDRKAAESAIPECLVRDNDNCTTEIRFDLPLTIQLVQLYYVSDKGSGIKEPIEVDDADERRFLVEIDLGKVDFEPTPPPATASLPTPTIPSALSIPSPTSSIEDTPTFEPTLTLVPTPVISPIVDVPGILGKSVDEVEQVLGEAVLITPNDDNDDDLAGGEYRDYQIGKYYVFVAYDEYGISRVFQVLEGLSDENYLVTEWDEILPMFGVNPTVGPDREAPAAVYWDNFNGLFVAVAASSVSGQPVWTVQIAQSEYGL